ncbi:MAG: hypothetical protein ACWGMZ_09810, partial [Thermoguttaceae bacterium]
LPLGRMADNNCPLPLGEGPGAEAQPWSVRAYWSTAAMPCRTDFLGKKHSDPMAGSHVDAPDGVRKTENSVRKDRL